MSVTWAPDVTSAGSPAPKEANACGSAHLVACGHNPVCAKSLYICGPSWHGLGAVQKHLCANLRTHPIAIRRSRPA